jgi:hypothetical protein
MFYLYFLCICSRRTFVFKSYDPDEDFRSVFNNLLKVFSTARILYLVFGADRIGIICISFF